MHSSQSESACQLDQGGIRDMSHQEIKMGAAIDVINCAQHLSWRPGQAAWPPSHRTSAGNGGTLQSSGGSQIQRWPRRPQDTHDGQADHGSTTQRMSRQSRSNITQCGKMSRRPVGCAPWPSDLQSNIQCTGIWDLVRQSVGQDEPSGQTSHTAAKLLGGGRFTAIRRARQLATMLSIDAVGQPSFSRL